MQLTTNVVCVILNTSIPSGTSVECLASASSPATCASSVAFASSATPTGATDCWFLISEVESRSRSGIAANTLILMRTQLKQRDRETEENWENKTSSRVPEEEERGAARDKGKMMVDTLTVVFT